LPFKPVQAVAQRLVIAERLLDPVTSRRQPAAHVYVLDRNSRPSPYIISIDDRPVGGKPNRYGFSRRAADG